MPWTDPVDRVIRVPLEKVEPNEYNPNHVASRELSLLYLSIKEDGYTQPVVTYYDAARDRYVIVDGYHRYLVMKYHKDIYDRCGGLLPVVVIEKPLPQRMASTVRHNRARGRHEVTAMASIVYSLLDAGYTEDEVCRELGMSPDEVARLRYVTGFARLFDKAEYRRAWETRRMALLRHAYTHAVSLGRSPEEARAEAKRHADERSTQWREKIVQQEPSA